MSGALLLVADSAMAQDASSNDAAVDAAPTAPAPANAKAPAAVTTKIVPAGAAPGSAPLPAAGSFPLAATVTLSQNVGSATFVASPTPNPTVSTTLGLTGNARLGHGFVFSVDERLGIEWTRSDTTSTPNQIEISDLGVRLTYSGFSWPDAGLGLFLTGGYAVPLSMQSRQAGSLGPLSLGARLGWNHSSGFSAYGSVRGGLHPTIPQLAGRFVDNPVRPYVDRSGETITPLGCIIRDESERDSYVCNDGIHSSLLSWSTGIGVSYAPPMFDGQLVASVDLGYSQAFSRYLGADDELTAERATPGLVPRQSTMSNLSVSYVPASWFVLTVGAQTGQPFLTSRADAGVRLPLAWDFGSPANNFSSLYVDTSFTF